MKNTLIISETVEKNRALLFTVERCIYFFRRMNYDRALRLFAQFTGKFEELVQALFEAASAWAECGVALNAEEIVALLTQLLELQKQGDYILLADLLEQQVKPWLFYLQEQAGAQTEVLTSLKEKRNSCFQKNLEALKKLSNDSRNKKLLKLLEQGMPSEQEGCCQLEYTSSGAWTCSVEKRGKRWYLHSNGSPAMEGFQLAEEWLDEKAEEYSIFGIGLGYVVQALFQKSEYFKITVYESNASVLRLAMTVTDFSELLLSKRFELQYFPLEEQLQKQLFTVLEEKSKTDGEFTRNSEFWERKKKLILFEPEVRAIESESVQKWMEDYFIQDSSIRNQQMLLNGNFRKNFCRKDSSIVELLSEFQGKDLYIIAAGPSLDKNFMALKELKKRKMQDCIILATGTVFQKLLTSGIRPDYVLVTDANRRVLFQIHGVEEETVPMLYLSTAYFGFAETYQGKKYIVYQKGYPPAETYARQKEIPLVRTGGSVSTTALDLGLTLQCKRIIFLGLDLSYPDGYAHAKGTSRRTAAETEGMRMISDIYGKQVATSRSMDMYREWIEQRIESVRDIPILDATEGGARIRGMQVVTMQQLLAER